MRSKAIRIVEWLLAAASAVNCLVVAVLFAHYQVVTSSSSLWPFPGLYLIEIALAGAAGWAGAARGEADPTAPWAWLPWLSAGILLAFVILGGFSIGPYLIPAVFGFTLAGLLSDLRRRTLRPARLGALLAVALIQGGLMLILVSFI